MCIRYAGTWHPLVSVITTLYVANIFHRRVVLRTFSVLHNTCIRSSDIILIPQATFVPNFVSFTASIAELAHGEKLCTQSLTHSPSLFDARGTEACALEKMLTNWCYTHSKVGISHVFFGRSRFALAAAEVTEAAEAAAKIAASDGSTEQEQCLHVTSLL